MSRRLGAFSFIRTSFRKIIPRAFIRARFCKIIPRAFIRARFRKIIPQCFPLQRKNRYSVAKNSILC